MIFDTHCHLGFGPEADPAGTHARARAAGVVGMLDVGIDLASSRAARERASGLRGVFWSAGLHPNDSGRLAAEWDSLEALARSQDCVAIGETGLDYYRDRTTPEQQVAAFERHLALAVSIGKPVVVHCREAFPELFDVLRRAGGVRGVMHCFSGGPAEAETALALGMHVSFAAPITYPKSDLLRAACRVVPRDRLLVETDAPFLPPQGRRGERNEPAFVVATLERLAAERGEPAAGLAQQTTANACALFGVSVAA